MLVGLKKTYTPPKYIEPAADNNVMKITENCLFMRSAWASLFSGRNSMSWWASVTSVFVMCIMFIFSYGPFLYRREQENFQGNYLEYFLDGGYLEPLFGIFFALACFWIFIPWRRQLPIIFNRKTRKVTYVIEDKVIIKDWQDLQHVKAEVASVAAGGAPIREGVLGLIYYDVHGKRMEITIKATEDHSHARLYGGRYGAAMLLAYINLFMQEGMQALPPICPSTPYSIDNVNESMKELNPFKILRNTTRWSFLFALVFFVIATPFSLIAITGDIIYFYLDRILPRRKWPQELLDACDGVWDGKTN